MSLWVVVRVRGRAVAFPSRTDWSRAVQRSRGALSLPSTLLGVQEEKAEPRSVADVVLPAVGLWLPLLIPNLQTPPVRSLYCHFNSKKKIISFTNLLPFGMRKALAYWEMNERQ